MRKWWTNLDDELKIIFKWLVIPVILALALGLVLILMGSPNASFIAAMGGPLAILMFGARVVLGPKTNKRSSTE